MRWWRRPRREAGDTRSRDEAGRADVKASAPDLDLGAPTIEALRAGAVAAWVRDRADRHLADAMETLGRIRRDAALEVERAQRATAEEQERGRQLIASAQAEAERLARAAAINALEIIDAGVREADACRAKAAEYRDACEREAARWLAEAELEAEAILDRAEQAACELLARADAERAARESDDARRAHGDLTVILELIEDLLREVDVEVADRKRAAELTAESIIASARDEAARILRGRADNDVLRAADEVAARRWQRRIS